MTEIERLAEKLASLISTGQTRHITLGPYELGVKNILLEFAAEIKRGAIEG